MGIPWWDRCHVRTCMLGHTCRSPVCRSGRVFRVVTLGRGPEVGRVGALEVVLAVVGLSEEILGTALVEVRESSVPGASCKLPCRLGIFHSPRVLFLDSPPVVDVRQMVCI